MFNNDVIFDFIVVYVDPASGLPYAINLCLFVIIARNVRIMLRSLLTLTTLAAAKPRLSRENAKPGGEIHG